MDIYKPFNCEYCFTFLRLVYIWTAEGNIKFLCDRMGRME
jgi:hypothetical protein